MRRAHLAAFAPICPAGHAPTPLRLESVWREDAAAGRILDGRLACDVCGARYPILGGVACLAPDPESRLKEDAVFLLLREDLAGEAETAVAAALGSGGWWDSIRQHLNWYGRDHYGAADPLEPQDGDAPPGEAERLLDIVLDAAGLDRAALAAGPALDLGAACGGLTLALARRGAPLALGLDAHIPLLRLGLSGLRDGVIRYPRRISGLAYERREIASPDAAALRAQVDLWRGDALAPPLSEGCAATVIAFNLLDCVADPAGLLDRAARLLRPGGWLLLAAPYDWSLAAAPAAAWIGGRPDAPDPAAALAGALQADPRWRGWVERDGLPWRLRQHERATTLYRVHGVAAQRA